MATPPTYRRDAGGSWALAPGSGPGTYDVSDPYGYRTFGAGSTGFGPPGGWGGDGPDPLRGSPPRRATGPIVAAAIGAVLLLVVLLAVVGATMSSHDDAVPRMPAPVDPLLIGGSLDAPLVNDDTVILFTVFGITAVRRDTRAPRWQVSPCPDAEMADPVRRTFGNTLLIRCGRTLRALAVLDGHEQWKVTIGADIDRVRAGDAIVGVVTSAQLEVFDARTGKVLWSRPNTDEVLPLAVDAMRVYSGQGRGLLALDAMTGKQQWIIPIYTGWLHVDPEGLFVRTNDHRLVGVDPATGAIRWQTSGDDPRLVHAVVIGVTARRVVLRNDEGEVHVFDTQVARYVWSFPAQAKGSPRVGLSEDRVVVTSAGVAQVFDASQGQLLSTESVDGGYVGVGAGALVMAFEDDLVVIDLP